jgi:hypothetical protein
MVFWLFQPLQVLICAFGCISAALDHKAFFRQFMPRSTLVFQKQGFWLVSLSSIFQTCWLCLFDPVLTFIPIQISEIVQNISAAASLA